MKSAFNYQGEKMTIDIQFYQNNKMPNLILTTKQHELYDTLTENLNLFVEKTVSIRSDRLEILDALEENGWVTGHIIRRQPSGFIEILYVQLTDKAHQAIEAKREELSMKLNEE